MNAFKECPGFSAIQLVLGEPSPVLPAFSGRKWLLRVELHSDFPFAPVSPGMGGWVGQFSG